MIVARRSLKRAATGRKEEGRARRARTKRNDVRVTSDEDEPLHNNIIITMAA